MNKKTEIEREVRLLAQRIRHEVYAISIKEKMLDHIRKILELLETQHEEEMLTEEDHLAIHKLEDKIALSRYDIKFHKLPDVEQKKVSKWAEESYFEQRR